MPIGPGKWHELKTALIRQYRVQLKSGKIGSFEIACYVDKSKPTKWRIEFIVDPAVVHQDGFLIAQLAEVGKLLDAEFFIVEVKMFFGGTNHLYTADDSATKKCLDVLYTRNPVRFLLAAESHTLVDMDLDNDSNFPIFFDKL